MEALAGSGVWLGLAIGFLAGVAFQRARQAWDNLRKARDAMPDLRKNVSGSRRRAALWILLGAGYAVVVLLVVINI